MNRIWVAYGSNQENPVGQLIRARQSLSTRFREIRASGLYCSAPWGYTAQPEFINAVVCYETDRDAHSVLHILQETEQAQGRKRPFKHAPRTLDLDLLLYEKHCIRDAELTVPHPGIGERIFVLLPLADIAPELDIPGVGRVKDCLEHLTVQGITPITHAAWQTEGE